MTILYADDDSDDLTLFEEAIKEIDPSIECVLAGTGIEALEFLKKGLSPDLIFLDIYMPEMDGITCLTRIRESEKFGSSRVILLSVSPYLINKERIKGLATELLTKPNNYEDLLKMLNSTLPIRT